MQSDDLVSLLILVCGLASAAGGLFAWARFERGGGVSPADAGDWPSPIPGDPHRRAAIAIVAGLALLYTLMGAWLIDDRGMTHVEAYVPGLDLPAEISEPPPRHGLVETVVWHWHFEPQPPGWFVAMWGWTKVFGPSTVSIRAPGLLFGWVAIFGLFALGARVGRRVAAGVLAAALLALNGHHLHWSLMARPYEAAMALGVLSTVLWLAQLGRRPPWPIPLAYVLVTVASLCFHVLAWLLLASQMAYTVLARRPGQRLADRMLGLQTICLMLGSPMAFHALYTGRDVQSGMPPSWAFTVDYLDFGFLYQSDPHALRDVPLALEAVTVLLALGLLALFLARPKADRAAPDEDTGAPTAPLVAIGIGLAAVGVALLREAWRSTPGLPVAIALPLLAAAGFASLARLRAPTAWPAGWIRRLGPMPALALGTVLGTYALSLVQPAAVSRALLIAVPPLLVCLAIGLLELARRRRAAAVAVGVVLLAAHAYSLVWYAEYAKVRDYRGLAAKLDAALLDGDLVLVRQRDWLTTPLFYHLPRHHDKLVAGDYAARTRRATRVWAVLVDRPALLPEVEAALADFDRVDAVEAKRVHAFLYARRPAPTDAGPSGRARP